MSKPVQPKILDEKFPEFQKLLDNMEVERTPFTRVKACLSSIGLTPYTSGQNQRSRALLDKTGRGRDRGHRSLRQRHTPRDRSCKL